MAEAAGRGMARAPGSQQEGTSPEDFAELREILVGPERETLRNLQARLDDPQSQTEIVSNVLADAITLRSNDPHLNRALSPAVERAIDNSVRRNAKPLADALFPVMGPAIRKAIAHALATMVQSLNHALEQSLSWRAIRWRIDAWRTGKKFSEIVLLHTLLYRVEQAFLIHRKSGLLLLHVTAPSVHAQDADVVSAMLTAIRDFVHDSFGSQENESLDALKVGELAVWIEQGPEAILAAEIRGTPLQELRSHFQDALESIHFNYGEHLSSFSGDTAPFEAARPLLEDCLESRMRPKETKGAPRLVWALAGLVAFVAAIWTVTCVRDTIRWNRYIARLKAEPGIIVIAEGRQSGRYFVTGLRDSLAANPDTLAREENVEPQSIAGRWELYQALTPTIVLARARNILRPPQSAELRFEDGVLSASGAASRDWIADARKIAPVISGVVRYNDEDLQDAGLIALQQELESTSPRFVKGTDQFSAGQSAAMAALIERIRQLAEEARQSGLQLKLAITGHTDSDGPPETNVPLSRARAEAVRQLIMEARLAPIEITTAGVGSAEPKVSGTAESDKEQNRRVSFKLSISRPVKARTP